MHSINVGLIIVLTRLQRGYHIYKRRHLGATQAFDAIRYRSEIDDACAHSLVFKLGHGLLIINNNHGLKIATKAQTLE